MLRRNYRLMKYKVSSSSYYHNFSISETCLKLLKIAKRFYTGFILFFTIFILYNFILVTTKIHIHIYIYISLHMEWYGRYLALKGLMFQKPYLRNKPFPRLPSATFLLETQNWSVLPALVKHQYRVYIKYYLVSKNVSGLCDEIHLKIISQSHLKANFIFLNWMFYFWHRKWIGCKILFLVM